MAVEARSTAFQEAIDFLAGKVNLPTARYDDLVRDAHVRAFTVAGVMRDDMLADFRAAIEKARREGTGYGQFRKDFDAIVDRTGWKFKARGISEETRRAWRASIIYRTNMRTSYMAGRWKQLTDPDLIAARPWWQYIHSGARHPRKTHLALDRKVFAATDPLWTIYFPPNGWGCGCDVKALSDRDLAKLGKSGADEFPLPGPYPAKDPRTGEDIMRYPGIDRGWEYNGGKAWLEGVVPQELRQTLPPFDPEAKPRPDLPPLPAAALAGEADILPGGENEGFYLRAFMAAFGLQPGDEKEYRDASGGLITVSERLFEARGRDGTVLGSKIGKRDRANHVLLIARAILEPDEIWAEWVKVASGVALRRSYLKRFRLPDAADSIFVRFEWSRHGWIGVTGFNATDAYVAGFRKGALLWRRS